VNDLGDRRGRRGRDQQRGHTGGEAATGQQPKGTSAPILANLICWIVLPLIGFAKAVSLPVSP
jgi:hypothetical protein